MYPVNTLSKLNKIDSDLKNLFESVHVGELAIGGNFFFQIDAKSTFKGLNESECNYLAEAKVRINKHDLNQDRIKWIYSTNPLSENADWIEKISTIDTLAEDIYKTISEGRMDKQYLSSLEEVYELITENVTEITKDDLLDRLKAIARRFEIEVRKVEQEKIFNESFGPNPVLNIKLYHDQEIKLSDKFKIENAFNKQENVDWVIFKEGFIELNIS